MHAGYDDPAGEVNGPSFFVNLACKCTSCHLLWHNTVFGQGLQAGGQMRKAINVCARSGKTYVEGGGRLVADFDSLCEVARVERQLVPENIHIVLAGPVEAELGAGSDGNASRRRIRECILRVEREARMQGRWWWQG